MSEQQDILISTSVLLKAPRDQELMRTLRDLVAAKMQQAVASALDSEGIKWSREGTAFRYLENPTIGVENAKRCSYCSSWATDRSKLHAIDGLIPGCEIDGRWVCDQCIERHDKLSGHTS